MKHVVLTFFVLCFYCVTQPVLAQDTSKDNPIYDRDVALMQPTDTIPDYRNKTHKLKLTGIVYQSDGVTPAKDVIIYIEQPDEDGDFELRNTGKDRYVFHRSWVKTDTDGRYTFHTFIPGNDRRYNQLQQIFPLVKAPSQATYELHSFIFDDDPLLTKRCRRRLEKHGQTDRILTTKLVNGIHVAQKNIVLSKTESL